MEGCCVAHERRRDPDPMSRAHVVLGCDKNHCNFHTAGRDTQTLHNILESCLARVHELTVPEIAAATGLAASDVLWYVASLKKYGEILEGPKDSGYYRYRLNVAATPADAVGPAE